mmetsp:Transcript_2436/g.7512  ORF Transcript_2436/g.7512 Transcript_2436/m.7512 type:complete len:379 (-) Transcript_2436:45-1181(-)
MSNHGSFFSQGSGHSSESDADAVENLRQRLINFYRVVDPAKLQDETKVNELVRWARVYTEKALSGLIQRKYGLNIDDVDASESGWHQLRLDLQRFYLKHDRTKPAEHIDKIFKWTRQEGLARLNERLVDKYGVPLHSVKQVGGGGLSKFKQRYKHILIHQNLGNLSDEVRAFFSKFDENRPIADIDQIVQRGMESGRDAVNRILFDMYGHTLADVKLAEGATSEERAFNLRQRLRDFYKVHGDGTITEEKIQAMCEWGAVHYEDLNDRLRMKYGSDLDSSRVNPNELRIQLFAFFSNANLKKKGGKGELDMLVNFAQENGIEALNERLVRDYGKPLPEVDANTDKELLADQAPRMARSSFRGVRKSLSNVLRRSDPEP